MKTAYSVRKIDLAVLTVEAIKITVVPGRLTRLVFSANVITDYFTQGFSVEVGGARILPAPGGNLEFIPASYSAPLVINVDLPIVDKNLIVKFHNNSGSVIQDYSLIIEIDNDDFNGRIDRAVQVLEGLVNEVRRETDRSKSNG